MSHTLDSHNEAAMTTLFKRYVPSDLVHESYSFFRHCCQRLSFQPDALALVVLVVSIKLQHLTGLPLLYNVPQPRTLIQVPAFH